MTIKKFVNELLCDCLDPQLHVVVKNSNDKVIVSMLRKFEKEDLLYECKRLNILNAKIKYIEFHVSTIYICIKEK